VQGFSAVIFQHECDHLDGVLYIDKTVEGSLHQE
jgi:peptide deformylase